MARSYRKVDEAVELLRKALGMTSNPASTHGNTPYKVLGAVEALVRMALEELLPPENTEDSPAFLAGSAQVDAWASVELPFEK